MDLLCCETEFECQAYTDPTLLNDKRVLQNLLKSEESYTPSCRYLDGVQREITPPMRKIVAEWMLELCEEQKCQEEVFLLSMNYMDRFLSVCSISKSQLQLVGTVCLLIASKLRESKPLSPETLVYYTDRSISLEDLYRWELLVLTKLKWDVSAVTPHDFLKHILQRLPIHPATVNCEMVLKHAQTLIALCARDYKFSFHSPSIIAAASLAAALKGLGWTSGNGLPLPDLLQELQQITATEEQEYLYNCMTQLEDMVAAACSRAMVHNTTSPTQPINTTSSSTSVVSATTYPAVGGQWPADSVPGESCSAAARVKLQEHEKAGTPTDVHDVHF